MASCTLRVDCQPVIEMRLLCAGTPDRKPRLSVERITRHISGKDTGKQVVVIGIGILVGAETDENLLRAGVAKPLQDQLAVGQYGVIPQDCPAVGTGEVLDVVSRFFT